MLWQILLLIFSVWIIVIRRNQKKILKKYKLKESDLLSLPVIGHAVNLIGDFEAHMQALKKFGQSAIEKDGVSATWMFNYLYIAVAEPVIGELVLKTCLEKGQPFTNVLRDYTGDGSIFAPVPIWNARRKVIVSHVTTKRLSYFVEIFKKQSAVTTQRLEAMVDKEAFSIWPYLSSCTIRGIIDTIDSEFSYKLKDDHAVVLELMDNSFQIVSNRLVSPWLYTDAVFKLCPSYYKLRKLKELAFEMIDKAMQYAAEIKIKNNNVITNSEAPANTNPNFLELFDQVNKKDQKYSRVAIKEEILVLIAAATDTSASTVGFIMLLLALHEDVQEKIYREIKEVFGDSVEDVTKENLQKLEYLDCVLKECLRLYPPVPVIVRKVDEDIQTESGLCLPKGSNLVVFIYTIHRHPAFWGPDAEEFRPERFYEPLKHPAQFMPFSYGPRNCAGYRYAMLSMKTLLSTILMKYRVLPASKESATPNFFRLKYNIMMKEVNGFKIKLEYR